MNRYKQIKATIEKVKFASKTKIKAITKIKPA